MLAAIIRDEPEPVTKLDPKLPALFGWIVQRCLSKDAEERYSSTRDLVKELQDLRTHLSEAVSAADNSPGNTPRLRRRVPFWVLAAVAALAVAVGLFVSIRFVRTGSSPAPFLNLSLSFPNEAAPNTYDTNPLALSSDGKTLVYAGARLFVRRFDRDEIRPIPGTEGARLPFISPDGLEVGFFAGGQLKKVSLAGGAPVSLCEAPVPRGGSWGADGTIVFAAEPVVGSPAHPGLGRRAPGRNEAERGCRVPQVSADRPGRRTRALRSPRPELDKSGHGRIAPDGRAADSRGERRVPPVSPDRTPRLHSPRLASRRSVQPEASRDLRTCCAAPQRPFCRIQWNEVC